MARSPTATNSVKRLAIIAPDALSLLRQRASLIDAILDRRHSVLALVPERDAGAFPALNERGLAAAAYPMPRTDPQLLADGKTIKNLAATLGEWRAQVLLGYGPKPMLLGALAAKKAGVGHRVGLMTALPEAMTADAAAIPSWGWRRLMKSGLRAFDQVVFHNGDQPARLRALGLIAASGQHAIVPGAGVDLIHHAAQPLPVLADGKAGALNFLMIARHEPHKGVAEFCQAAKIVRARAPQARFILAGPEGSMTAGLAALAGDDVQVLGDQADVRPLIGAAHVVAVPSWGEGCPRILLEALAAGRPVIASDIPGCREAVDERVNGVLVPPRDAKALADAIMSFVAHPDLNAAMARASRSKAERRFAVAEVNAALLRVLGL
jgi:glycosyltransferase involved in cell wall biosynthesis